MEQQSLDDETLEEKEISGEQCHHPLPLLSSMLENETIRNEALDKEGSAQINSPKSSDGWIPSLFIIKARALDWILLPWCVVVLHAVIYTIIQENELKEELEAANRNFDSWEIFFGIMLNSTLSFLLVFRLNRAAGRFWLARELWGNLVAKARTLTGGILIHAAAEEADVHREEALRWMAAFPLTVMELLRGNQTYPTAVFAGILTTDQIRQTQRKEHPPLFVGMQIRYHLHEIFRVHADSPVGVALVRARQLEHLEGQLNVLLDCCGGMERIRNTPLPMVYVSHLRTFLLLALLIFPYIWGPTWSWGTIPVVATAAFALLGIEAAASEVEAPFQQHRINALNMDGFCKSLLSNMQGLMMDHLERNNNNYKMPEQT